MDKILSAPQHLKKQLTLLDVFCIASGAMISSGIFVLPGLAHVRAGPGVIISYFLAGLLAIPGMLSQAELVSAMPKAGGTYFYVTRSMGSAMGTIDGMLTWFSLCLKTAFALIGMAAFAKLVFPQDSFFVQSHWGLTALAFLLCVAFIVINIFGIKEAGRIQIALVSSLFLILFYYIVKGIPTVQISRFEPFAPYGADSIFYTAGYVFVAYGGLLKVASIAEEVVDPARTIPRGMILSLGSVSIFYTLVVFVTCGILESDQLNYSLTPLSDGAFVFAGQPGRVILSVAALLAFISTANAGIMAASRYPLALSRDKLLPPFFKRIHKRFQTPYHAILFTGGLILIVLFLKIEILVKVASTTLILTFILSNLSVIILRESRIQNYQPRFFAPLYPWMQIIGIIMLGFILFEMEGEVFLIALSLIGCAILMYMFYGRIRANRQSALLSLIERITAKELISYSLESELKEIIQERDEIIKDRFDHVIEQSVILDIKPQLTVLEFFKEVAEELGPRIGTPSPVIYNLLLEREKESTTVISPEIAIPHIIIEGGKSFNILVARCRGGVIFSQKSKNIQAVFVLAGSRDERNFHLRALTAIAQIVSDPHFIKNWLAARSIHQLRDIVLLGKRRRK